MSSILQVHLLHPGAKLPVCSRPGSDLGYDLFALESTLLTWNSAIPSQVRTGIAVRGIRPDRTKGPLPCAEELGFLIKDRSSMAAKGVFTHGGVIDAGYRGELKVLMTTSNRGDWFLKPGDKIAQLVPVLVLTGDVVEVDNETWERIKNTDRGDKGFGSSGR